MSKDLITWHDLVRMVGYKTRSEAEAAIPSVLGLMRETQRMVLQHKLEKGFEAAGEIQYSAPRVVDAIREPPGPNFGGERGGFHIEMAATAKIRAVAAA